MFVSRFVFPAPRIDNWVIIPIFRFNRTNVLTLKSLEGLSLDQRSGIAVERSQAGKDDQDR